MGFSKTKLICSIVLLVQLVLLVVTLFFVSGRPPVEINFSAEDLLIFSGNDMEAGFHLARDEGGRGKTIISPELVLRPGLYRITIRYDSIGNGQAWADFSTESYKSSINGIMGLSEVARTLSFDVPISEQGRPFRIYAGLDAKARRGEMLSIHDINVETSPAQARYWGFLCFLVFALLDAAILAIIHRHSIAAAFRALDGRQRLVCGTLLLTAALLSLPALTGYLLAGHDLGFHLMRIEGLADGFNSGQFPVRIQPTWMNEHGYGVSIFYGDVLLYIPAFLRWLGWPLGLVYNLYIIGINTATVFIAYHCFSRMSKDALIGLMAALLYAANPYRLANMYTRSAVGEYTAMMFFPLLAYGLWRLYATENTDEDRSRAWPALTLGFTGIILSHTISTALAAGYTLLVCLLMWKKTFQKNTLIALLKAFSLVVLLCAWFLIPFFDYMRFSWASSAYFTVDLLQRRAVFIPQFFSSVFNSASVISDYAAGMAGEMPLAIGLAASMVLAAGLLIKGDAARNTRRHEIFLYVLIILTLFGASTLFPWRRLALLIPQINYISGILQFPWRLLAIAAALLSLLAVLVAMKLADRKRLQRGFIILIAAVSLVQAWYFISVFLNEKPPARYYAALDAGHFYQMNGEYLPLDANVSDYGYAITNMDNGIEVLSFNSHFNAVSVTLTNRGDAGSLEVPLIHYHGYRAHDTGSGESLSLSGGTSQRVRLSVPAAYDGTVLISFVSPWYWRVAELLSVLTVFALLWLAISRRRKS